MRYYLDTNIIIFILTLDKDNIDSEVSIILKDYSTLLYASSVAIMELLLLYRIGKLKLKSAKSETDILEKLEKYNIEIKLFNQSHFQQYSKLIISDKHKDMNDHAIIAQAISDRVPLISSDRDFKNYVSQGLEFVYNKR